MIHDEMACLFSLKQGLFHGIARESFDFEVHLEGGNAVFCAADFEVHITEVVFIADDVSEHGVSVAFGDEAHGDACDGSFDGDAGVHKGEASGANGGHGGGAVTGKDVTDETDCVWEFGERRNDGTQSALSEHTVSDFAPAGCFLSLCFADGIGREVVVQEEIAVAGAEHIVESEGIAGAAKSARREGLSEASAEEGRAVSAGKNADLALKGSDLIETASVEALSVEDICARVVANDIFKSIGPVSIREGGTEFFRSGFNSSDDVRFGGREGVCSVPFTAQMEGILDGRNGTVEDVEKFVGVWFRQDERHFFFSAFACEGTLCFENWLSRFGSEIHACDEVIFGDFAGAAFDHNDAGRGDTDDEIHVGTVGLFTGWEGDEDAVFSDDAKSGDWAVPGDVADHEGEACGVHGHGWHVEIFVTGKSHDCDDCFASVTFWEEGAKAAVIESAGEGFGVAAAKFAASCAGRKMACAGKSFAVFDGKREEILFRIVGAGGDCDEQDGFSASQYDTGICLRCPEAGFKGDRA